MSATTTAERVPFARLLVGTEPPVPASVALGFAHGRIRTAIADLEGGRTSFALSALQTALAMLDSALAPELRMHGEAGK